MRGAGDFGLAVACKCKSKYHYTLRILNKVDNKGKPLNEMPKHMLTTTGLGGE
jgi:hypothetical protein